MKQSDFGLAREGVPFLGLCALLSIILALIDCATGAFVFFILTAFVGHFFRDPNRVIPQEAGVAVSPADGKVIKVGQAKDPVTGENRTVICIFMNVFSVHVNRSPVAGAVEKLCYFPGKFINASLDKASEDNERLAMSLRSTEDEQWTVVQIAGLIARRIVPWTETGDSLRRGERYGLIKFGSRLDLYLPQTYDACVRVGEKVFAGQSIIAKKNSLCSD